MIFGFKMNIILMKYALIIVKILETKDNFLRIAMEPRQLKF